MTNTFKRVAPGVRRNLETGVEIRRQKIAGEREAHYMVTAPHRYGFDVIEDELGSQWAEAFADERVELCRENVAEAWDEAHAL